MSPIVPPIVPQTGTGTATDAKLLDTGLQHYQLSRTVGAYDGTLDYGGTSGFTETVDGFGRKTVNLTLTGADMAPFIGSGALSLNVYSYASFSGRVGGNGTMFISQNFVTTAAVTYGYTPVPVPATVCLFGSGIAGVLGLRRRRRE